MKQAPNEAHQLSAVLRRLEQRAMSTFTDTGTGRTVHSSPRRVGGHICMSLSKHPGGGLPMGECMGKAPCLGGSGKHHRESRRSPPSIRSCPQASYVEYGPKPLNSSCCAGVKGCDLSSLLSGYRSKYRESPGVVTFTGIGAGILRARSISQSTP